MASDAEAVRELRRGLDMIHNGLMDPTRSRQAVGEVCAYWLGKADEYVAALPSSSVDVERMREALARLTYQSGRDFSEDAVQAEGYDFASWERGFGDAIATIKRRLEPIIALVAAMPPPASGVAGLRELIELRAKATSGPWHLSEQGFSRKQRPRPTLYATDDDLRYLAVFNDQLCFHEQTDNLANARFVHALVNWFDANAAALTSQPSPAPTGELRFEAVTRDNHDTEQDCHLVDMFWETEDDDGHEVVAERETFAEAKALADTLNRLVAPSPAPTGEREKVVEALRCIIEAVEDSDDCGAIAIARTTIRTLTTSEDRHGR